MSRYTYTNGYEPAEAIWPPVPKKCMAIGYVNAPEEPRFSRDIGRSFVLGERIYYMYGDTFRNDAGLISNTYQLVKDRTRPTDAIYLSCDENGLVKPLLELTEEEEALEKNDDIRTALWCFGGVVEISKGMGLTWYQKHQFDNKNNTSKLQGVGLAMITADERTGELTADRFGGALLFDSSEPLMGSFSATNEGGWVYVWGQKDDKVYLGRVSEWQCHDKGSYTFWNGVSYTSEWQQAVPVMQDMQQGQIVRSSLFGNQFPWLFVGVTRWADDYVMMGVSPTLEGPWLFDRVGKAHGFEGEASYKYCMYPHLWGSAESEGKLLVTWCDAWPGGVIAAEVDIAIKNPSYWIEIRLNGPSYAAFHSAIQQASRNSQDRVQYDEKWLKGPTHFSSYSATNHYTLHLKSECKASLHRAAIDILQNLRMDETPFKPKSSEECKIMGRSCRIPFCVKLLAD